MDQETVSRLDHAANELLLEVLNVQRLNIIASTICEVHWLEHDDLEKTARHIVDAVWACVDFSGIGELDVVLRYPVEAKRRACDLILRSYDLITRD